MIGAVWSLCLAVLPLAGPATPTDSAVAALQEPGAAAELALLLRERAAEARQRKAPDEALWAARLAAALAPSDPDGVDLWAQLEAQAGRPLLAEQLWLWALSMDSQRPQVRFHLGQLLATRETLADLTLAAEHLEIASAAADPDPSIPCLVASVAARQDQCPQADGAYLQCRKRLSRKAFRKQDSSLLALRGDCHWRTGDYEAAEALYAEAKAGGADVAARLEKLAAAREQARVTPVTPDQQKRRQDLLALAGRVLASEALSDAEMRRLSTLVQLAPEPGIGHAALGLLAAAEGRSREAELAWLRALAQGLPGSAQRTTVAAALGRLYLHWSPASRPAEAATHLLAALSERPLDTALRWEAVDALRKSGQLRRSLEQLERWLRDEAAGDPERRREALALRTSLLAALPAADTPTGQDGPKTDEPTPADSDERARAAHLAGQDRVREAVAVLRESLSARPNQPELQRDLAIYLHGLGDLPGAVQALERSLSGAEAQPQVQARLGRWLLELGRKRLAIQHLKRAEELGVDAVVPTAVRLELGTLEADPTADLWHRGQLQVLLGRVDQMLARHRIAAVDSPELGEARLLQSELRSRLRQGPRTLAALAALIALLLAFLAWRRWGGANLRQLLDRHPDTGPEMQRILASIRHEVLKHNALVLEGLIRAVDKGDSPAAFAARDHLLGTAARPGVEEALQAHVAALQQVGAARGMRLNLERRDAAIGPLIRGFAILRHRRRLLGQTGNLSASSRRRLLADLRLVQRLLAVDAYEAVRFLLDAVRSVRVDGALIAEAFSRAIKELGVREREVQLEMDQRQAALWVRITRPALDEALANLLRNAVQASLAAGEHAVGCRLSAELDPITGLETALIAVLDRAAGELSVQDVQQRPIERGLGLAAEAMARHDGSLDVQDQPAPWRKAVILRLPRALPPGEEAS